MEYMELLIIFVTLNVLGYVIMYYDKRNSRTGKKRVSEASLLTVSALGGSIGTLVAMIVYHHKTKKKRFTIGLPMIIVMQLLLITVLV